MTLKFFIRGAPFAKQGDRSCIMKTKNGKSYVHHYQTTEVKKKEWDVRQQIIQQLPFGFRMIRGPIIVKNLMYVYPPLKSLPKRKLEALKDGSLFIYKDTQPDLTDNLNKGVFDAMEKVVFMNDSQIVRIVNSSKYYGMDPGIHIEMEEVEKEIVIEP